MGDNPGQLGGLSGDRQVSKTHALEIIREPVEGGYEVLLDQLSREGEQAIGHLFRTVLHQFQIGHGVGRGSDGRETLISLGFGSGRLRCVGAATTEEQKGRCTEQEDSVGVSHAGADLAGPDWAGPNWAGSNEVGQNREKRRVPIG